MEENTNLRLICFDFVSASMAEDVWPQADETGEEKPRGGFTAGGGVLTPQELSPTQATASAGLDALVLAY